LFIVCEKENIYKADDLHKNSAWYVSKYIQRGSLSPFRLR